MYKQISIKNLKIFKNEQKLKIAPITLLYGENSSGKTSLLKTFDIVHNIFSEGQVKRGKNVSQKDSPFYRNENIQNISAKNIHYYSNQVNKKDIDIKILLDVLTNNRNILNTLKILNEKPISINRTLGLDKINIDNYNIDDGYLNIPLNISIKIKHFKKKEISKVDKIEIQSSLGKSLINFSRINKEYKKIDQVFDKDKVGYLSPNFNKILIRPNRYSGSFNRGRPVAEEDYFVDEALYADYKVSIKEKTIWKNLYKNYVKIFTNNSEIKSRYEKIKNIFNTLNNFDNWKLKSSKNFNNIKINFEDFAYFIAKFYLSGEMPKIFFSNNKIKKWFRPRFSSVEDILNNLDNKEVCYNIKQIVLKDLTRFNNLTSAQLSGIPQDKINCPNCGTKYKIDINLVPRTGRTLQCSKCKNTWKFKIKKKFKYDDEEKLFLKNFLLAKRISNSKCINKILIKNKLEKKNSSTKFINSCKLDQERFKIRFYKRSPDINYELIHEGLEISSESTFEHLNVLSRYISDGLDSLFYEYHITEGFNLPAFKEETVNSILRSCIREIKKTVNNFVISHPSKTNIDWHVARKTDFPKGVLERIQKLKLKEIKENISKGRTILAEQDELTRNSHNSRVNIDPAKISADGRNFHTTIINNPGLRLKLNKTLKDLLGLEIKIVTPKFLKQFLKNKESFHMLREAQREGRMYPVGLGRYSRTKYIIIRDLKFKKIFEIHGDEIGKGPSNILPFIAQILSNNPSLTYIIQELENNWHPKYQAALIELIANNMRESQKIWGDFDAKTFILETHSELFILQLKKLIQKGILKPQDVSINLIQRNQEGNSEIYNIPLNSQGGFEKKWPGGFFTERMEILTS